MKIEIKNKWTGSVLFELEKEDNTIKDTLIEAVKHNANLCGADLSGANLFGANLSWAILCDADLRGANLCGANLFGADLRNANLRNASLCGANLCNANLCGADLRNANLSGANLSGANLCGADLSYANLRDANLRDADLRGVKEVPYIPMNCPSDGTFIGWKKVNNHLIQLEIPEDAKRSSATTMKCRCDKAKVLKIVNLDTNKVIDEITNIAYYQNTVYKVGEMVYPDSFDEDRWNECSHGIHFFVNKQEAIDY